MRIERLDGIRALAILMVFVGHTDHPWTKNWGWQGVDLFFVLSGFLITGILRRDSEKPAYWRSFYIKRATRILPPFAVCLLCSAILTPSTWKVLWPYDVFFLADLGAALYPMLGGPLGVLWSLAVEEHFYMIWPFAPRSLRRKSLVHVLLVIIAAEPVIRLCCTHLFATHDPIYLATPFRFDGLALGSLLAIWAEDEVWRRQLSRYSLAATLLLALLYVALSRLPNFNRMANSLLFNSIGYSLVALISTAFISYVLLHEESVLSQVLAWRPMAFIGRISYGMYLYHLLVMEVLMRLREHFHKENNHVVSALLVLSLSVLVSWLSARYYEGPIMRFGHRKAKALNA